MLISTRATVESSSNSSSSSSEMSNNSTEFTCPYYNCLHYDDYVDFIEDYIYPKWYEWVFISMHLLVFVVGIVGNLLVCVSVYRNRSMRTVTNYFIVNLAVADFLVILICLPPTVLWDVTETWFFGIVFCKLILYFQNVSVCVSVLTLSAISMDRWYAICNPLKFKGTSSYAKLVIILIWVISLAVSFPHLVWLRTKQTIELQNYVYLIDCQYSWGQTGDYVHQWITVAIFYLIPLTMMSVAYYQIARVLSTNQLSALTEVQNRSNSVFGVDSGRWSSRRRFSRPNRIHEGQIKTRRKAAKMLIAVVVLFAFCYLPVHLLSMLRIMMKLPQNVSITIISLISHWLSYFNSAANPIIYSFMNGKFRKEFYRAATCVCFFSAYRRRRTIRRLRKDNGLHSCRTNHENVNLEVMIRRYERQQDIHKEYSPAPRY